MRRRFPVSEGAGIGLFIAFAIALVAVVILAQSHEEQACHDAGGEYYSRTVGKIHYHKCVTDDNKVIDL